MLEATAHAEAGLNAVYTIGSNLITWDPKNHWRHTKPNPSFTMTEHASGEANFQGTAHASLIPSITMHVNHMFTYTLKLDPQYNFEIHGDTKAKQICEKADYDVNFSSRAELEININFLDIHKDRVWGPDTIWDKNGTLS
jgi:hypothetical protein